MSERWMLYGATGFTGQLLAEEAVAHGHRPILAGRSEAKLAPLASRLGLPHVAVSLADELGLRRAVEGCKLVFHAAGPFVDTAAPMREACLAAGAHYADLTGELSVFEDTFALHERAKERGVVLLSGAGFDVVPTDCLGAYVAARLPGATKLELAIAAHSSPTSGTTQSAIGLLKDGVKVRRGGVLVGAKLGEGLRRQRFSSRETWVMPLPLGELATLYRSTGVRDVTTCFSVPSSSARALQRLGPLLGAAMPLAARLATTPLLKRAIDGLLDRRQMGPDEQLREKGNGFAWARASDDGGRSVEAWIQTPEPYLFTAKVGVRVVEALLGARREGGALTPSQALGVDFPLQIPGTRRLDAL